MSRDLTTDQQALQSKIYADFVPAIYDYSATEETIHWFGATRGSVMLERLVKTLQDHPSLVPAELRADFNEVNLLDLQCTYIDQMKPSATAIETSPIQDWLLSNIVTLESMRPYEDESGVSNMALNEFPLCRFSKDTDPAAKEQAIGFLKKYHTVIRDQYHFIAVDITDGDKPIATAEISNGFMDRSQLIANYSAYRCDESTGYEYVFVGLEEMIHHIDTLVDCHPDPTSLAKRDIRQQQLKTIIRSRKKKPADAIRAAAKENYQQILKYAKEDASDFNITQTDAISSRPKLLEQEQEHGRVEEAIDLMLAVQEDETYVPTPWGQSRLRDIYHPVYSAQETWSMMLGVIAKHAQEKAASKPKPSTIKVIRSDSGEPTRPMRTILKEANVREKETKDYRESPPDWSPEARQAIISAAPDYTSSASGGSALYYLKEENRTTEGKKLLEDGGVKELYVDMLTSQPTTWPMEMADCDADHLLALLDAHQELPTKILMMIWLDRYNPNLARDVMLTFDSGRDQEIDRLGTTGKKCDDTETNSKLWEMITGGRALPEEYQIRIQATDIKLPITRCYGKYHDDMIAFKQEATGLFDQYQAHVIAIADDSSPLSAEEFIAEQREKIAEISSPQGDAEEKANTVVEEPVISPAATLTWTQAAAQPVPAVARPTTDETQVLKNWATNIITASKHPKSKKMQQALDSTKDLPSTKETIKAIVRLIHRKHGVFNLSGRYLSENNPSLLEAKGMTGEDQRFHFLAHYIDNYSDDYSSRGIIGTTTYNAQVISKDDAEVHISPGR
ncbi:MAG: hypothetical protein P1U34_01875 [Coxiellaceae bacterium]|nr:hypothetical protein [Coxiellaceae bacterium]